MNAARYLASDGFECPYCGSHYVTALEDVVDVKQPREKDRCQSCGREWVKIMRLVGKEYRLVGITQDGETERVQPALGFGEEAK